MSTEFIFGKNSVEALIQKSDRSINKIFILSSTKKDGKINNIIKLAKQNHIPVSELSRDKFKKLLDADVNHQGVIASVSPINYANLDDVINKAKASKTKPLIVLLDGIEDPQNLGAIVRSSEVLGANAIILTERRSAVITGIVSKVSAGAVEFIPIVKVTNLVKTMDKLKKEGYWIIGAEYEKESKNLFDIDYNMPCAIVMGSEGKGLSRLVKESCDIMIKIPQAGQTNSLNVANALSIILYEVVRQRLSN